MSEIINRELAIQKVEELARKQLSKANVNCVSVNAGEVIDCLSELPTVDEKEIIRKTVERIVERLEEERSGYVYDGDDYCDGAYNALGTAITTVKEEGGSE